MSAHRIASANAAAEASAAGRRYVITWTLASINAGVWLLVAMELAAAMGAR